MFSWLWRNSPDSPWGQASWWGHQAAIQRGKPDKFNTSHFQLKNDKNDLVQSRCQVLGQVPPMRARILK